MPTRHSFFLPLAFSAMTLSFLSGCKDASQQSIFAPACPVADIPGTIADRFVYDEHGIDIGDLVSHAQITGASGDCSDGPKDSHDRALVRTRVGLTMTLKRGPAASGRSVEIPYFIAILRDGKIIDKKVFTDRFTLARGLSVQKVHTPLRIIDLPVGPNPQISPYTLEIGYQLTRSELDYNRAHLPKATFRFHVD